jgi:uncharacterized damage-inducible protein DinB
MSATSATRTQVASAISFDELLRHNEDETIRWQEWFRNNPAALDVPYDGAETKDVRGMVLHIFLVEVLYTERMQGIVRERVTYDDFPFATVEELFAYGARAREQFRKMVSESSEAWWNEIVTFGVARGSSLSASRRKMFAHVLLHSMRHWAQLATALRRAGFKQDWKHDFIFTNVIA